MKYFTNGSGLDEAAATSAQLHGFLALISPRLESVEASIRAQALAFDPSVQGYVDYAVQTHGKRLRPALALLAGGATGGITDAHESLAMIMELIHLATLIHDDILDGAEMRRDQPTANARWGNHISVLLGDCLFAHALDQATHFEEAEISRTIARAATAVCTGEILQTQRRFDLNLGFADYYRIIEMKTAALFGAAAELGAALNGAPPAVSAALKSYGLKLGSAYQIYDDLLDLAGDEAVVGKTLGTDLKKGKLTLPVLLLLQSSGEAQRDRFTQAIVQGDAAGLADLRAAASAQGALAEAAQTAIGLVDEADAHLDALVPGEYEAALRGVGQRLRAMISQIELSGAARAGTKASPASNGTSPHL